MSSRSHRRIKSYRDLAPSLLSEGEVINTEFRVLKFKCVFKTEPDVTQNLIDFETEPELV